MSTLVVSTRVSPELLALIYSWFESQDRTPKTRSDLLAKALKVLGEVILTRSPELKILSREEALDLLVRRGLLVLEENQVEDLAKSLLGSTTEDEETASLRDQVQELLLHRNKPGKSHGTE